MTQFITLNDAQKAIQDRIDRLTKLRNSASEKMDKFAEDLYYGLSSQVQVDAINDGFNGALAYYDTEITHLKKMLKFVEEPKKESRVGWHSKAAS